jgi:hypothetical protein
MAYAIYELGVLVANNMPFMNGHWPFVNGIIRDWARINNASTPSAQSANFVSSLTPCLARCLAQPRLRRGMSKNSIPQGYVSHKFCYKGIVIARHTFLATFLVSTLLGTLQLQHTERWLNHLATMS